MDDAWTFWWCKEWTPKPYASRGTGDDWTWLQGIVDTLGPLLRDREA